ncbi:hypothetical protein BJV82DRAFT_530452 [Fennellomyces sp. T-0311]|nr:hypothetical protein BJV82DRAFT_530452 [Fennellomyces sp. T-0311]
MADSGETVEKRIYIGGLHSSVNDQQLHDRFSRYGTIDNVTIAKDVEGNCRGFGHFNISTTPKQWASCLSLYNGAKWKGQVMRLEEAKMDYAERKRKENELQQIKEEKQRKKRQRMEQTSRKVIESRDMSLVTDKTAKQKRGWRQGRYGRGIAIMRLTKPDGTQLVYDPKLYSNNLTKLYDIGVSAKPVSRLPMYYEDIKDEPPARALNQPRDEATANKDNDKRLAAMERRAEAEKQRQELVQQALAKSGSDNRSNHVTFETSDNEDVEEPSTTANERPAPRDSKWMFDSDSEEDNFGKAHKPTSICKSRMLIRRTIEIKINPVLEGEKGRELLALQSKFKGDDRFKLGEEFMEDDYDTQVKQDSESEGEPADEISKNLTEEKNQSMDLLRAMFGEEKVEKTKPKETQWSIGARYDPDAEDAENYLRKSKEEREESENDQSDDDVIPAGNTAPVTAMPVVSTEKHFEVNMNMKPLFGGQDEPFKLFGGDDADTTADDNNEPLFGGMMGLSDDMEDESGAPSFAPKQSKQSHVGLGVLFFFHTEDPSLMKKSCFGYDPKGSFQRTDPEGFEDQWKEKRAEIGEILKKRQKQAVRRHKKLQSQGVK